MQGSIARRAPWVLALIVMSWPSPAAAQGFGGAVAVSEDHVFVGQVANTSTAGTVKVYSRASTGGWVEAQTLAAADADEDDRFGRSLAASGELLVVGATTKDSNRGAAYVFTRAADGTWNQFQKLQPEGVVEGDNLGRAVAVHGDWILVSSAGKDEQRGLVFAFRRGPDGRFAEAGWVAPQERTPGSLFGLVLAARDGHAIVSAPGEGRVYGFHLDGVSGTWAPTGVLEPADSLGNANFGSGLAMSAGRAFVGAPTESSNRGAIHVFDFDAESGSWSPSGRLLPFDGATAAVGASLAFVGDELWASAPIADGFSGGVYRFIPDGKGGWSSSALLVGEERASNRQFGMAVAGSGTVVAVGAPGDAYGIGSAFIYEGRPPALSATFRGEAPPRPESITGGKVRCQDGDASGYGCRDYDLLSFLSIEDLGGSFGVNLNDIWGWTDPETDHEWALVGRVNGTAFVDITDPTHPVYAGELPMTDGAQANAWRDIKVYRDHAFIVADGAGPHGMQVFDLRRLRDVTDRPVTFDATALYTGIHSAHNIVINEDTGFAYTVGNSMGGETCGGGYHIIDIRDPANPTMAGCWGHAGTGNAGTGYSHDAQCVLYHGPDPDYRGREVCLGSNETAVSIADLTDKKNPRPIAVAQYPNVAYTHQGWLTEDHRYFFVNDEGDESSGKTDRTRTLVWDLEDLDEPELVREFLGNTPAIDHNLYVHGNLMYQSNYSAGLRVIDVTDPASPVEVGFFDVNPKGDAVEFTGSWSNYPFFRSGTIAVSSIERGLFLVKKQDLDI